jgi:CBS domain-containing membrane protein
LPHSPLAQPWPLLGGHLISAAIGVASARALTDTVAASALAMGGCVLGMLVLRCLHPPGAATAMTPVLGGPAIQALGFDYVWLPVGLNVALLALTAIVINRWLLKHDYPAGPARASGQNAKDMIENPTGLFTDGDLRQALSKMGMFVDVTVEDLSKLLGDAEQNSFKRFLGEQYCRDIMDREVQRVEYDTEVEDAWRLMQRHRLKSVPVVDRRQRVIGIVTWNDFLKYVKLIEGQSFRDGFLAFFRRTPGASATKPEAIGHVMTRPVTVLRDDCSIAELIPLMAFQGLRQIPIVDAEQRLVGMVYQASLIAALYRQQLATLAPRRPAAPGE